ncbi:MAG: TIGR02206 family membrane protein [Pirellulales bacterium]
MPETIVEVAPFASYGASHWSVLALLGLGCVALVAVGRRLRGTPALARFNRAFALVVVGVMVPMNTYLWLPSQWDLKISLPFDLCDLAWGAAAYTLWTGRTTLAYGAVYYWGLTLTTQGLFTPDLREDFPHIYFIMFFASHCLTPAAAIYLTWGVGMRPTWKLMWGTVVLTMIWGACMLLFNTLAGTNYLYVNAKPQAASLLDLFGPWPAYLAVALGVATTIWALLTWPWYWFAKRAWQAPRDDAPRPLATPRGRAPWSAPDAPTIERTTTRA